MSHGSAPPVCVTGYHGTTRKDAESILANGFEIREKPHHWLGQGVYFWQDAPHRASQWALEDAKRRRLKPDVAVLRVQIQLEDCIDLLDISWFSMIRACYWLYRAKCERCGVALPPQEGIKIASSSPLFTKSDEHGGLWKLLGSPHRLDCDVVDYAVWYLTEKENMKVGCIRSVFLEGERLYEESHLYDKAHVQVAVRDLNLISNTPEII